MEVTRIPGAIKFDIQHLPGDRPALTARGDAGVLNGVLQIEQHPRRRARVALVHQYGSAAQQIAVPLKRQVEDRIEQRVARADKRGERLTLEARVAASRTQFVRSAAARVAPSRSVGLGSARVPARG